MRKRKDILFIFSQDVFVIKVAALIYLCKCLGTQVTEGGPSQKEEPDVLAIHDSKQVKLTVELSSKGAA